ncbi:hypothetical protein O6H91_07G011700 [Diphasiastrum complanatum]|uniref:Uncharacterized protein n=1 Tax=Diphasiastrum complanatum TaxID=34168 RepID=A0ACC2D2F2_DIPCM|nr:hypothetical protein O6H91_07G011700 [Diphasiastrum complanatum]
MEGTKCAVCLVQLLRRKEERKTIDGKDFPRKKTLKQVHEGLQWKEKFNQVNAKLLEIQGAKSMLSAEVGRLQHALQCEVGEHIPLSKVLEDGGGWKGRGQQICLLKDKITELKGKIQLSSLEDFQRSKFEAREMIQKQRLESLVADFLVSPPYFL